MHRGIFCWSDVQVQRYLTGTQICTEEENASSSSTQMGPSLFHLLHLGKAAMNEMEMILEGKSAATKC